MKVVLAVFVLLLFSFYPSSTTHSQTVEELQQKIRNQELKIQQIEKEIAEQQKKIQQTGAAKQTLQAAINELEATKESLESVIQRTQSEITESELTLQKISIEITDKEKSIALQEDVIAKGVRNLNQLDSFSLMESLLNENLGEVWQQIYDIQNLQSSLHRSVRQLKGLQVELAVKAEEEEEEKNELEAEKTELDGEKQAIQHAQNEKDQLLTATKNQEATYKQVLAQKIEEKRKFEQELFDFESQLEIAINPDLYQTAGKSSFSWPVDNVVITQEFGQTAFAQSFKGYARPFHNGMDFGVPIGTPVKAVMEGVVKGTDNTDLYPNCNSWGGWVLVEHPNGLSTLYAHLSSALVSPGQSVARGETIALSGSTGVSTGPHLHLTVYASQGVQVRKFKEILSNPYGCALSNGSIPTAPLDAYLNPRDYLP